MTEHPRVLIVDDEIIIARELEARLTSMGYDVAGIAATGRDSLALARDSRPDIVLMDIMLKGDMDGIDAAAEIHKSFSIPVIYLTAFTDERTLERAKTTEPYGYVVKPFSERELKANIEMALYKHDSEDRMRKVEGWFSRSINELANALIVADASGVIEYMNRSAEAITEWTQEEARGKMLGEVLRLRHQQSDEPIPIAEELAESVVIINLGDETSLETKSGARLRIDCTTTVVRNDDQTVQSMVAVFRDVSGQMRGALAALNAEVTSALGRALSMQDMLKACAESIVNRLKASLTRIWTVNALGDTLLLQASAGPFTPLSGFQTRVSIGQDQIGLIAQRRKPYLSSDLPNDQWFTNSPWVGEQGLSAFAGYPLLVDDRLVGVMALFAKQSLHEHVLKALESVAASVSVGIERKRLEEQVWQNQKLEAIGLLAGGIAHDFNNLLTVISGYSAIALRSGNLKVEQQALIKEINKAGERAAALTRQLLAFSRKQVLDPKIVDLNGLVSDLERMLHRLIGEDITLTTMLGGDLWPLRADAGQLEQVLMNLVVNARDAMALGGSLTVETSNIVLDETYSQTHNGADPGEHVLLSVSDTGCGMEPEVVSRIFEPFFTTKSSGLGTGLGLSTVHGIVKQSGGHIAVESEPGRGTKFRLYFPRAQALGNRSEAKKTEMPPGSETILLVEDEEAVRAIVRTILESCGYRVLEAVSGDQAVERCNRYSGSIHLILTDVVMPGCSGRSVVARLLQLRPGTKVLYMSGYTDDAVIRHGVLQAEMAFIQKPFAPTELAEKVRAVLDQPV